MEKYFFIILFEFVTTQNWGFGHFLSILSYCAAATQECYVTDSGQMDEGHPHGCWGGSGGVERAASSTHHTTTRQLDLEQICRLADWSMASSTYLKFYKRYVWVSCLHTILLLFVLFGPPPSTESSVYNIYLPRVTSHCHCKIVILLYLQLPTT